MSRSRSGSPSDSDAMFRALFEIAPQATWVHDARSRELIALNEAAIRTLGFSRDDLLSMSVDDLFTDDSRREIFDATTSEPGFVDGGTVRHADGQPIDVEVRVAETQIDGRPVCIVAIHDISEQHRAAQELSSSERQLAHAQRIAHVGSFEWEMDTNTVRWSDELYRIYGLDPGQFEATYEAFLERIHPDDREKVDQTVQGTVEGDGSFRMEERIVRPDETIRVLESHGEVIREEDDGPRLIGVCRDVTELREAERERDEMVDALSRSERQLADAQRLAHVGSFEWEMDTNTIRWSDELYRIYGLEPREFAATYEAFLQRIHPDDREKVDQTVRGTVEGDGSFRMEERIVRPDGTTRVLESHGELIREKEGPRLIGVCRDVTELRQAERERDEMHLKEQKARQVAEKAKEKISEILERITDAFVALDKNWCYTYVNLKAGEIFGRDRDDLIGKHIWTEFPEGVGQPFHLAYERAMATQRPLRIEEYYPPWDRWFENRIYPSPNGIAIYFTDVTERRKKEEALREVSERLERTESFSLVMLTHVSLDGQWLKIPPTLCELLGYSEYELLAMTNEQMTHPDDVETEKSECQRLMRGEMKSFDMEKRLIRKDGSFVWVYVNCSGVYDTEGALVHFVIYIRDITEKHRFERQLQYQALHDELTTLPNRTLFNDRLDQALVHAHRHGNQVALLLVDLHAFKLINESFGHSFGDLVVHDLADRLRANLRETDTIARVGGDQFGIIVVDFDDERTAHEIAEKVHALFQQRVAILSRNIRVSASIGVSIHPRDGVDRETLFKCAVNALHRSKELGSDNIQFFTPEMSERHRDRLEREEELRRAIEEEQFVARYQPLFRLADRSLLGVEALARWNHPGRGLVGPEEFISLAEETRMIVPLGSFMLRSACHDVQAWTAAGLDSLRLSVNLSVRQFHEVHLLQTIDEILEESGLDPSRLELEITETVAMENVDLTMKLLRALRERKISIAIDDFGSGHSSLIYLRRFPISTIKIDKIFISDLTTDPSDASIVRAVIALAHELGMQATAEGVETEEQLEMLAEFGCDIVQGFLFDHPVPCEEIEAKLRRRGVNS